MISFISLLLPVLISAATVGTLNVTAEQSGQTLATLLENGATIIKEVSYIGLDASTRPVTTAIRFSGTAATPAATVVVMIPDAQVSETTTVADDGTWTLTIPTSVLTAGNYYAYAAVAEGDQVGDSTPAAYFTVQADQNLSWPTWIFLGTSSVSILALLSAITLQLGYNSKHHPVL
ncbi:MAG: hypothetical protein HY565_05455 [Candidatus Kerfeldbacteria bacterium]|nr:hypothetical protein [Candidatus Kerfeldbacteria bacterium]